MIQIIQWNLFNKKKNNIFIKNIIINKKKNKNLI